MATSPPKGQGSFKDPLSKWDDGTTRGAAGVFRAERQAAEQSKNAAARIRDMENALTTLKGSEAATMRRLIRDALAELAKAQAAHRASADTAKKTDSLRIDTAAKLAALRRWISESSLSPEEKKKADHLKASLSKVLIDLNTSKFSSIDFEALEESIANIQLDTSSMSSDLQERFANTESSLASIRNKQDEAKKFLEENRELLRSLGSSLLRSIGGLSLRLADKVGIGAFNLGNAFRVARAVGKGIGATSRAAGRLYRGETYVQKYLEAKRTSSDGGGDSLTSHLIEMVKKTDATNHWFQRKLLKEVEKQGKTRSGSQNEGLASILAGFSNRLGSLFGAGGILKALSSIGTVLGPIAAAGRFVLTRAFPVIGAFLGGWQIGSEIYKKYQTQIQDAIETVIGSLGKAYNWIKEKASSAGETAGRVFAGAKEVGSAVVSHTATAVNTASTAASNLATSASDVVADKISQGKGYISQGFDKLSNLVGSVIRPGPGVNLDGLHPGMQTNVGRMASEYFQATGKKLDINSAHRDHEEQARLYRTKPPGMAARPGSSLHNYGLAVDIPSSQVNELEKLGLLDKYGLSRPIKKERWHVEPRGMSLAAAKAGIYSADAPANQSVGQVEHRQPGLSKQSSAGSVKSRSLSNEGSSGKPSASGSSTSPVRMSQIPTIDTDDGLLAAMNLRVF